MMFRDSWLRNLKRLRLRTTTRRRQRSHRIESLEERALLTMTVESVTPSLVNGAMATGTESLKIRFSEDVDGTAGATPFELRSPGADGLPGNADDVVVGITSATYAGDTASLSFPALSNGTHRLTVLDSLTNTTGVALDGDADGMAGGHYVTDFVVTAGTADGTVDLVSARPASTAIGNDTSRRPTVSADGRFVAFESGASNLVPGDATSGTTDVFVKNLATGSLTLVSTTSGGTQGNSSSQRPSISADGRYVAFRSWASNLVAGDTNGHTDIFRKDLLTGAIERVSTAANGAQAIGSSEAASISADGRYVAFASSASNLVPGDTNGWTDIFVKDMSTGAITRVDTSASGSESNSGSFDPSISGDGQYVAFETDASNLVPGDSNGQYDIFVKHLASGAITRVSQSGTGAQSNSFSMDPTISADGQTIAFYSFASNLVPGDTNGLGDVFVANLSTGGLIRASVTADGVQSAGNSQAPDISDDGRFVAFRSTADDLVPEDSNGTGDIFVKDLATGTVTRATTKEDGTQSTSNATEPSINGDGSIVAFRTGDSNLTAQDANSRDDILVKDLSTGIVALASIDSQFSSNSSSEEPSISADGRYVAFRSFASDLVVGDTNGHADIFVKDVSTGAITRVNTAANGGQASGDSGAASISADGRYVAFESSAANLVAGDTNGQTDIFVKDLSTGAITRVSTAADGSESNNLSVNPALSANGLYVAFESPASNLVPGDTNGQYDIFVKDLTTGSVTRVSKSTAGTQANSFSNDASISADGQTVAFYSFASNLVTGDTNGLGDVFIADLSTGGLERASITAAGSQASGNSQSPDISDDGRFVAFYSTAADLVPGDTNGSWDVFVKDVTTGAIVRASTKSDGTQSTGFSAEPAVSGDGQFVAFRSSGSDLVASDTNGKDDIFVKDLSTGAITRASSALDGTQANSTSRDPSLSADGQFVAFGSDATNLVSDATRFGQVFRTTLRSAPIVDALVTASCLVVSVDPTTVGSGQLLHGPDNAFDGLNQLQIDGADFAPTIAATLADSDQTLVTGTHSLSGLNVSREVSVPNSGSEDVVRTMEVLENPTSADITTTVRIFGNLGADADTTVFSTSDGDSVVEVTDEWIGTDDADNAGSPAIVHYVHGPGGLAPDSVQVTGDNIVWQYDVTVPAGETVRLATFTIIDTERVSAVSAADSLVTRTGFASHAADFLDSVEVGSLLNFGFARDFGDAPEAYGTLLEDDGPRHIPSSSLFIGGGIPDDELDAFGDGTDDNGDATDDDTEGNATSDGRRADCPW